MKTYRKGVEFERKVKKAFEKEGFTALRSAGSKGSDLYIKELSLSLECKALKSFSAYRLMKGSSALVVKANHKKPLIVLPLSEFLRLLRLSQP